ALPILRRDATSAGGLAAWGSPALQLSCLPPVLQAARRFAHDGWVGRIQAIVRHYKRSFDLTRWDSVSHLFATGVGALAELASIDPGLRGPAADAMELAAGAQQSDGSLPALPRGGWCSTSGCLGMAGVWYRLGQKVHADRAWDAIAARQLPNGGFVGSYGRGARYFPRREVAWGALQFLDVTLLRVAATFAEGDAAYAEISTDDARLKTVRRWSARLPDNASIADVGCGRGRYLQHLATWLPRARLVGVDLSERWCREMPRGVEARAGSLLRIPAADGEFDAVLAIESLEHSLLPRRALREMFRVLRPGGRLLIIDKDAAAQPLSKHEPWEQWFAPRELSGWLSEGCQEVAVRSINLPKGGGKQVYVAWSGVRRGQTERRRAA
ncbi:MAG: class I SAM-dependent methyltransferase, partial [Pirellulales bacterium]